MYIVALGYAATSVDTERATDRVGLLGALAIMHFAWGAGYLVGSVRFARLGFGGNE
jgi:hypothetical protein